jgi:hypothetical protein
MDDPYERLKAQMPEIAKAVNAFASEQVQQQAFRVLIRSLAGDRAGDEPDASEDVAEGTPDKGELSDRRPRHGRGKRAAVAKAASATGIPARATGRRKAGPLSLDKSLNLRPKDRQSFADFAAEKTPRTQHEKNVVAVYWLTRVAGLGQATVDQVYTCYKDRTWRVPPDLRNNLAVAASTKAWIDTSNMDDLKVTVNGENYVEHDLPPKPKA